jgi:thiosulfate dehydrogenase (quinone) large subunit
MNGYRDVTSAQQIGLVLLRTLIGWHFLYEGYYKFMTPLWSPDGKPIQGWSSTGYLKAASGPVGSLFQKLIDMGWTPWMDAGVKIGLVFVGLSLILGLFTQVGCAVAIFFLSLFYILSIPVKGVPETGNEGTYLFINKTLIECVAVVVLLLFRTGRMAGLDLLFAHRLKRKLV